MRGQKDRLSTPHPLPPILEFLELILLDAVAGACRHPGRFRGLGFRSRNFGDQLRTPPCSSCIHLEDFDLTHQLLHMRLHRLARARGFFHQRSDLLRRLVYLHDGLVHLIDPARLLLRGRRDL